MVRPPPAENNLSVFLTGGFRKSLGIRLKHNAVAASALRGTETADSMLHDVPQTAISDKVRSTTCSLGAGGIVSHDQQAVALSCCVAREVGRSQLTGNEAGG